MVPNGHRYGASHLAYPCLVMLNSNVKSCKKRRRVPAALDKRGHSDYNKIVVWKRIEVVATSRTRNAVVRKGTWVRIPPLPPALHVSFDTKLTCSFLFLGCIDYAEMNLFAVNMAHFCIIHFLACRSVIPFHLPYLSLHPVFSPFPCPSEHRCGVLPVSVDKC